MMQASPHCRDRATAVELMGYVINRKSATGVARSRQ